MSNCLWENEKCYENQSCDCCESCGPQNEQGKMISNYGDLSLCSDCRAELRELRGPEREAYRQYGDYIIGAPMGNEPGRRG